VGITDLLDHLPDSIRQPPGAVWSVLARSLGEQGADGRTALAWRWALTGSCPSPVTLTQPPGQPPARPQLTAEAAAPAELSRPGADPGGQVLHARFVLQWLAGEFGALPLWNVTGYVLVTDGATFPRSPAQLTDVHSWALLAQWLNPWPNSPPSAQANEAHGYTRGITLLLTWTQGAAAAGPLTGEATLGPPSFYEVAVEVRHAMTWLDDARTTDVPILVGRMKGVMDTFAWLSGWSPEPPADRHGHIPGQDCPERTLPCDCDAAGTCLAGSCPACRSARCVHGFAGVGSG
jgi:hypothetical protein